MLLLLTRGLCKFGYESAWIRRVDFLHSEDTKRPTRAATIIFDSMRKAGVSAQSPAESIPGGLLLEIGYGRHAGLAPFPVGLGACRYIGDMAFGLSGLRGVEKVLSRYRFEKAGWSLRAIPPDSNPEALPERIDATWLAQYGLEELAVRTALLTLL